MARPVEVAKYSRFILLISACVIIAGLYLAREVLIPIALAVLLSFLLGTPVRWLERIKVPRIAATMLVVVIGMGFIGGVGFLVGQQLISVVHHLPEYQGQAHKKFQGITRHIFFLRKAERDVAALTASSSPTSQPDAHAGVPAASPPLTNGYPQNPPGAMTSPPGTSAATPDNPVPVRVIPAPGSAFSILENYAGTVLGPLGTIALVLVLVIFMLISREDLRDRVILLLGHGRLNVTTQALDEASTRISSYLGALSIVNGCYAVCVVIGLWLISRMLGGGKSFPNVLVWGILVGLCRFIPYIGIWVGAGIPLILSFALFDTNGVFLGTLVLFVALEIVVGQFVEPMWYGSSTGMSALAVLVAAVFWAWLWGPIGLLLSTPLTVILVVMGKYVPQLKFLDILLREEAVMSPEFRFYQRLIAMDQEEAADLAQEYLKEKNSLEAVYDDVLLPTLSLSEHDSHRDRLGAEQLIFVRQSVREISEELTEQYQAMREAQSEIAEEAEPKGPGLLSSAKSSVAAAASTVASAASNVAHAMTGGTKPNADAANARNGNSSPTTTHSIRHLPQGCHINVLCLPARDEADEIVALMLAQLLYIQGYSAITATATVLASEMVDMVEKKKVGLVCVSAMPPAAVAHARYLCKRLNTRYPELATLVGLWTVKVDLNRATDRIACSSAVRVVNTLHDALRQIEQLAQPLMLSNASPANDPTSDSPATAVTI